MPRTTQKQKTSKGKKKDDQKPQEMEKDAIIIPESVTGKVVMDGDVITFPVKFNLPQAIRNGMTTDQFTSLSNLTCKIELIPLQVSAKFKDPNQLDIEEKIKAEAEEKKKSKK